MSFNTTKINITTLQAAIKSFNFKGIFEELGWNIPHKHKPLDVAADNWSGKCEFLAELGGIKVFCFNEIPNEAQKLAISKELRETCCAEHILIFSDNKTQAVFYWVHWEKRKTSPYSHVYHSGQPNDVLINKLTGLFVDYAELDDTGDLPFLKVLQRLKNSFSAVA